MTGFVDTNVLIYACGDGPKGEMARTLIGGGNRIAVQSLNEFSAVMRGRKLLPWDALEDALDLLRTEFDDPVSLTLPVHLHGLKIARRYQLQIYDSMLLAAALSAGCSIFYSEDLADGLVIDGRLTIRNPFA